MSSTEHNLETAIRKLSEQEQLNSILTSTVRRVLDSSFSLHDIGLAVLDTSIAVSGSRSGVIVLEEERSSRVVDPYRIQESINCSITDVLNRIQTSQELKSRRIPGRIQGAYYLNSAINSDSDESGPQLVENLLCVPLGIKSSVQGYIVLIDNNTSYNPGQLGNVENLAEVYSLALARGKVNEDLRTSKEKAEQEAEAKSRFLAAVSHEIRSPLNGVLMMSSMLKDTGLNAEQAELVRFIMYSANSIDRLIRDLTDMTQINTGKLTINREDFNLDELCRNLVETNRPAALRKRLRLEHSVSPDAARFTGDRERIGQIIGNLLSNAIKYTDRGRVKLSVFLRDNLLNIVVSDTGLGIAPELQDSVFTVFNQGMRPGRKQNDGVGIGLSLVRELSELMGGQVSLESEPERGSVFTVELPATHRKKTGNQESLPDSARVLIVEDEGVNRLQLRALLERDGWIIDEALNGTEAVSLVQNNCYNLILMDIRMPQMGGLEASSLIRTTNPSLPIIAITANAYQEDRRRILEAGLNDIVLKPIDGNTLRRSIKRCLRS